MSVLLIILGCEQGPQAPVLRQGPVYENSREGMRFLVPEGWRQTASSLLPPGDFADDILLVRYTLATPEGGAMLVVLVVQEKSPINVRDYHQGPSFRVEKWMPVGESQQLTINGTTVEHCEFKAQLGPREMTKEVYAVRGNGRLYSFIGLYAVKDDYARQQIARAMNSLEMRR